MQPSDDDDDDALNQDYQQTYQPQPYQQQRGHPQQQHFISNPLQQQYNPPKDFQHHGGFQHHRNEQMATIINTNSVDSAAQNVTHRSQLLKQSNSPRPQSPQSPQRHQPQKPPLQYNVNSMHSSYHPNQNNRYPLQKQHQQPIQSIMQEQQPRTPSPHRNPHETPAKHIQTLTHQPPSPPQRMQHSSRPWQQNQEPYQQPPEQQHQYMQMSPNDQPYHSPPNYLASFQPPMSSEHHQSPFYSRQPLPQTFQDQRQNQLQNQHQAQWIHGNNSNLPTPSKDSEITLSWQRDQSDSLLPVELNGPGLVEVDPTEKAMKRKRRRCCCAMTPCQAWSCGIATVVILTVIGILAWVYFPR
jgi:hypothetical protein